MKKLLVYALTFSLAAAVLAGCGGKAGSKDKTIKVGACVTPHAEILEEIKDDLEAEGWTLEVIEYNDYVIPNTALESGELDANNNRSLQITNCPILRQLEIGNRSCIHFKSCEISNVGFLQSIQFYRC